MAEQISATFTWESGCGEEDPEPLVLTMSQAELQARDPELQSLLAAKMSFSKSSTFTMDATGPGEDEYMSPGLIAFVWSHIKTGTVEVTPDIEPADAERALEYFGFAGLVLIVPKSDPNFICKQVAYNLHRMTMEAAPKIIELIQTNLLSDTSGVGVHLIVDDGEGEHMNQFGDVVDHVLAQYRLQHGVKNGGATVMRFRNLECQSYTMHNILGTNHASSVALRAKVLLEVKSFGGFDAKWSRELLIIGDNGEYGQVSFVRDYRWVLQITVDKKRKSAEGIKRRKLSL